MHTYIHTRIHAYIHTYIHSYIDTYIQLRNVFKLTPTLPIVTVTRNIDPVFVCINVWLLHFTLLSLSKNNVFKVTDSPDGDSWEV